MKKRLSLLCVISLLAAALIVPIGVFAAGGIEAYISEDGKADRSEISAVPLSAVVTQENIPVTYSQSRVVGGGFADIYKDDKGNDYIFKDGKAVGFYSNEITKPASDCMPIGREAAAKKALASIGEFTENAGSYELQSFVDKENYGQYYITFARKLGDIFTEEYAKASVMYDGAVKSVAVYNDGEYADVPEETVSDITEQFLREYAQRETEIIYPDSGAQFEMTKYYLTRDDTGYYIAIRGDVSGMSERLRYYIEN